MKTLESVTLADILKHAEWEGDCLVWTGSSTKGYPKVKIGGKTFFVRRVIYALVHGLPIRAGLGIGVLCETPLCIHPDCLVARTKSVRQRGIKLGIAHQIRVAEGKRRGSALDMATVRAIRTSDEPGKALEARYGLKTGYVSRIRRAEVWKDHASPFAQLGGRA